MNPAVPDPAATPVLTVEQVAELLGLCRSGAYAAVARGDIPAIRVGRRIIVPTAAVARMLGAEVAA